MMEKLSASKIGCGSLLCDEREVPFFEVHSPSTFAKRSLSTKGISRQRSTIRSRALSGYQSSESMTAQYSPWASCTPRFNATSRPLFFCQKYRIGKREPSCQVKI